MGLDFAIDRSKGSLQFTDNDDCTSSASSSHGSRQTLGLPLMKQLHSSKPIHRLTIASGLIAYSALIGACGGGGGESADKSAAATVPSSPEASAAMAAPYAESASDPASGASSASSSAAAVADAASTGTPSKTTVVATAIAASAIKSSGVATFGTTTNTSATGLSQANITTAPMTEGGRAISSGTPQSTGAPAQPTAFAAAAPVATDARVYVDTAGNDSANGASPTVSDITNGPVRTLGRAQQIARTKLAQMLAGTTSRLPVRVLIGPGEYTITSTWTFTSLDSGTATAPVSYEAVQAGTVLISGAVSIGSKSAPASTTPVTYSAPTDAAMTLGGSQLYINGRRATLARQPNAGSAWFVQRPVALPSDTTSLEGAEAFAPTTANLTWISGLSTADRKRAIVDVKQSWTNSRHRLSDQSTPAGSVRIAPKAYWSFLQMGASQRYHIENVAAALDAGGEWIYENGTIRYIRQADEVGAQLAAALPMVERLILVQGETTTKTVQHLQFNGLSLAYTRYLTPDAGFLDHQGAVAVSAALEVSKARNIVIDNCNIVRTGGWGVWFRDGVRDSRISNSSFNDLGAGGIKVGLTAQLSSDTNATGANQIIGNKISDTGKLLPGAPALWVGQSWDNRISRNVIYNTTYTGISVGWTWGYADATSGRNLIDGNLLYNIGRRELSDLAAIYTLGKSPGTVISNNIIREVRAYPSYGAGAWGVYNDEGSSGIVTENNVVLGSDSGGYHLNYGRDNLVRNNIFAGGDIGELRVTKIDAATNLRIQSNLIMSKNRQPFDQAAQIPDISFSGNEISEKLSGSSALLAKCGTGCSLGNTGLTASSAPLDIAASTTTWAAVLSKAISAFSGVATASDTQSLRSASANMVPVSAPPIAPVATGMDFFIDIANTDVDKRPMGLFYTPANNPAIRVISRPSASSGKCLAFFDGASFSNKWEPYAYAQLNHTNGYTSVEFDLLPDATTDFQHEWRDDSSPYMAGPSISVSAAGVQIGGKVVAPVTIGEWIKFKISAPLGTTNAKWRLEITRANGSKTSLDNQVSKDANWTRLNWVGFISNAKVASNPCISKITASNGSS